MRIFSPSLLALTFVLVSLIAGHRAEGKDLTNRLGIGYSDQQADEFLPSITAKYYPNPKTGLSLALGVDTQDNFSRFGLLAKLYRVIFTETNLNFYMGGGAGILSREVGGNNGSGFEFIGFVGVEYFIPGLECLGFSVETGIGIVSNGDGVRFRTIVDHPLRAGVVFYF